MNSMRSAAPLTIHHGVELLCRKIGASSSPVYIPIIGEADTQPQECYANVENKVTRDGGELVIGWCIWELPGVLIEGEHHAVWRSPGGEMKCVSRRHDGDTRMLFVPDPSRPYFGLPIGNVRMSWPRSRHTDKWIAALEEYERFIKRHSIPYSGVRTFNGDEHAYHQAQIVRAKAEVLRRLSQ